MPNLVPRALLTYQSSDADRGEEESLTGAEDFG
jgi:hypothetical protein